MAERNNRQRALIGGAVVVFLGALIAAAALAQSTRNQSDPNPTNGALFAAESASPSVSVSPSPVVSPTPVVSPSPSLSPAATVTRTVSVTRTSEVTVTNHAGGAPSHVNAGTGGQASFGGLSPGAVTLGLAGVSALAVGSALMTRRRNGARL